MKITFPSIDVSRIIYSSPKALWDLLTDTRRWPEWGPTVRAVQCAERYIRCGTKGRVQTVVGLWLPFVITHFEDGRYWSWDVAGIPATGHRIEPISNEQCRLIFEVPLIAAPYGAVCKMAANRMEQILKSPTL